jgi:hypothetical protein
MSITRERLFSPDVEQEALGAINGQRAIALLRQDHDARGVLLAALEAHSSVVYRAALLAEIEKHFAFAAA